VVAKVYALVCQNQLFVCPIHIHFAWNWKLRALITLSSSLIPISVYVLFASMLSAARLSNTPRPEIVRLEGSNATSVADAEVHSALVPAQMLMRLRPVLAETTSGDGWCSLLHR